MCISHAVRLTRGVAAGRQIWVFTRLTVSGMHRLALQPPGRSVLALESAVGEDPANHRAIGESHVDLAKA